MESPDPVNGVVFNIQRFSIHDGPGIRTTVFLKGCPLRCFWCHNPEGLRPTPEVQFTPSRCIGCGACVAACANGAQVAAHAEIDPALGRIYHRDLCDTHGDCAEACVAGALQITGQEMTAEQVLAEVRADRAFYASTGGGVTLSGGEPLLQAAYTLDILRRCRAEGLPTAVETTTQTRWEHIEAALPLVDLWMVDIKHLDPEKHRAATGISNERILANIRRLAATGRPLVIRMPIIPTVNATPAEVGAVASFVAELNASRAPDAQISLELLPFHRLATDKYDSLGLPDRTAGLTTPDRQTLTGLETAARLAGVQATCR